METTKRFLGLCKTPISKIQFLSDSVQQLPDRNAWIGLAPIADHRLGDDRRWRRVGARIAGQCSEAVG